MERAAHPARRALTLARVALALLAEGQCTGAFPPSLAALERYFPDGVPEDPCVQAPFVYAFTPTGAELSVARWPGAHDPAHERDGGWKHRWPLTEPE